MAMKIRLKMIIEIKPNIDHIDLKQIDLGQDMNTDMLNIKCAPV